MSGKIIIYWCIGGKTVKIGCCGGGKQKATVQSKLLIMLFFGATGRTTSIILSPVPTRWGLLHCYMIRTQGVVNWSILVNLAKESNIKIKNFYFPGLRSSLLRRAGPS